MSIDELAYEYGWDKWSDRYVRERAEDTLFIDIKLKEFGVELGFRSITLKYNLTNSNITTLIKLFGVR